ncbi:hypothetical protein PUR28_20270, partial [Streptomyces sp. BE308]|uniref:hypothetical protein n=1 Tax=Streptomyces sp. BE308 TaxID=3002529 RepID=UPI002E77953B
MWGFVVFCCCGCLCLGGVFFFLFCCGGLVCCGGFWVFFFCFWALGRVLFWVFVSCCWLGRFFGGLGGGVYMFLGGVGGWGGP